MNLSGLPYDLLDMVEDLNMGPLGVVLFICVICIILGMVFEAVGLLLLIVPVFFADPSIDGCRHDLVRDHHGCCRRNGLDHPTHRDERVYRSAP